MDPTVVRRLVFAKFQLNLGMESLNSNTEMGAWQATIHFHDALETLFITIGDAVGVQKRKINFHDYPGEIEKVSKEPFSYAKIVDEINDFRTPLKHRAILPNPQAVRASANSLESVFEDNTRKYLNLSFRDVSLADMIQNDRVRKEVKDAEIALTAGKFEEALGSLRVAFDFLVQETRKKVPSSAFEWFEIPPKLFKEDELGKLHREDWTLKETLRSLLQEANRNYDKISEKLKFLVIGVNISEYARFDYITPSVTYYPAGDRFVFSWNNPITCRSENVTFCLNFVIENAVRLEQQFYVMDSWSKFTIRLKEEAPYFSYTDSVLKELGKLPRGYEIKGARLSHMGQPHGHWRWGKEREENLISTEVCEIVSEEPR